MAALLGGALGAYAFDLHHVRTVAKFRPWAVSTLTSNHWREESLVSMALIGLALTAGYAGGELTRYLARRLSEPRSVGPPLAGLALVGVASFGVALLYGRPPITEPDGIQVQRVTIGKEGVIRRPWSCGICDR